MKKTRHTEEQIAFALKEAETGTSVAQVIRRMGISEQGIVRATRQEADRASSTALTS